MRIGDQVIVMDSIKKDTMNILGRGTIIKMEVPPYNDKGSNLIANLLGKKVPVVKLKSGKVIYGTEHILLQEQIYNNTRHLYKQNYL